MPQATPTLDAQADPVNEPTGSEDEAAAAFAARDNTPVGEEPASEDPKPADEPAEDAEPEADEADPDDAPEADALVEVEFEGKTYSVPPEVEKALLRQSDYSRKMNEVGAKEKAYTARIAQADELVAAAEQRAEALASVRAIDERIKAYEGIDWAKAKAEDPAGAALAAIELLSLNDRRKDAVQAAANVARQVTEGRNKQLEDARAEMDAVLKKELKGWGDEMGTKVTRYALDQKVQLKTLQQLTDPALVIALDKARKYDALQGAKVALKGKASAAPQVVKPGAPRPRAVDPRTEAMARLRKDNTQESAEAAFLSRMR
jgi:hypothetical protein